MNPNQIQAFVDQLIEIDELKEKLKKWEACADLLIVYAKDYATHLSDLGEIDHVDNKQIELVENALEQYNSLKHDL